jgi:NAD-dependent dihydropyrimidine dehydrogenase PreA subunit
MINDIDKGKCISCGTCIEVCMKDVLRWDASSTYPEAKYFEDCQTCFDCEVSCPAKAIYVHPQHRETVLAWK